MGNPAKKAKPAAKTPQEKKESAAQWSLQETAVSPARGVV